MFRLRWSLWHTKDRRTIQIRCSITATHTTTEWGVSVNRRRENKSILFLFVHVWRWHYFNILFRSYFNSAIESIRSCAHQLLGIISSGDYRLHQMIPIVRRHQFPYTTTTKLPSFERTAWRVEDEEICGRIHYNYSLVSDDIIWTSNRPNLNNLVVYNLLRETNL